MSKSMFDFMSKAAAERGGSPIQDFIKADEASKALWNDCGDSQIPCPVDWSAYEQTQKGRAVWEKRMSPQGDNITPQK